MLEHYLIGHCSPTLANLKQPISLVTGMTGRRSSLSS